MSEHSRSSATFKNYAISLGILVGIVLIMAFVVSTRSGEHIPSVDYRPDIDVLRESADYPVTAPSPELTDEGWTPTSSTLNVRGPVEWSVGFATGADSHAMLTQSDDEPERVVADRVKEAEQAGTVDVDGVAWEHYDSEDWGALVLREDGVTRVVSGSADLDELVHLAEGLESYPAPEGADAEPSEAPEAG